MRKFIFIFCIVIAAQLSAGVSDGFHGTPSFDFGSMINPNQLDIHHSITFQSGINSNGDGYYLNKYTNFLDFKLHPKVDFNLKLNFVNFGTMSVGSNFDIEGNNDNSSRIVPEFDLEWRPNENMKINIGFTQGYNNSLFWDDKDDFYND